MIKYDFLFALRNFQKQKLFSLVNLFTLCLGMVSVALMMIYVQHELSYDRFNKHADQVYRVYNSFTFDGVSQDYVQTPTPLADFLQNQIPEIENTTRIARAPRGLVSHEGTKFYDENIVLADPSLFDIFTLQLIRGKDHTISDNPHSVILSESSATKIFGDDNPIGKIIQYNGVIDLTISGVIKDIPGNSHLNFSMIVPMSASDSFFGDDFLTNRRNTRVFTYILTHPKADANQLEETINKLANEYYGGEDGTIFHVQPLTSIHLYSDKGGEFQTNGDIKTVYIFSAIALLILLIACINYINLSLSMNKKRSIELGVRKTMGAGTIQLIRLFLSDAFILAIISVLISFIIIWLLFPWFRTLSGMDFNLNEINTQLIVGLTIVFVFIVGMTGLSSGWLAASQKTVLASRMTEIKISRNLGLHGPMVLFQFTISIVLIAMTLLIYRQMQLVKNKNLGLIKEQLMIIPVNDQKLWTKLQTFEENLLTNPNILSATTTSDLPGKLRWITSIDYSDQNNQSIETMTYLEIDEDFISTYGVQLKSGYLPGDTTSPYNGTQYLLNETAVQKLGWEDPIGKVFSCRKGKAGYVTGVVHDFNFKSLHESVEPLFMYTRQDGNNYMALKLNTQDVTNTISFIDQNWNRIVSEGPMEYYFYDDFYDQLYRNESRFSMIIFSFSCIAILIACLGIFGLAAFLSENRIKEIGIRKVNGAQVFEILALLNKDFIKWVVISIVIGTPIAWYIGNIWLEEFAYRTSISLWLFALTGLITLGVAVLTVSYQTWKTATRNPIEALKTE